MDDVAAVILWEGALAYREALVDKIVRERRAWDEALERNREAIRAAQTA